MTKAKNISLTSDELKALVVYDPLTGIFVWKIKPAKFLRAGDRAGSADSHRNYRRIGINGVRYLEHRLAWLYVHERWPVDEIDHVNGVKDDNRIENLRECSQSQNRANIGKLANNRSGLKGVYPSPGGRWVAFIAVRKNQQYLGTFDSKEEACAAYSRAAKEQFGEFARTE